MQSIDTCANVFDAFPKLAEVTIDFILLLLSQPRRWEDENIDYYTDIYIYIL